MTTTNPTLGPVSETTTDLLSHVGLENPTEPAISFVQETATAQLTMATDNVSGGTVAAVPEIPVASVTRIAEDRGFTGLTSQEYLVAHIDWTNLSLREVHNLIPITEQSGSLATRASELLNNQAFFNTSLQIRAYVNATPFHQGLALISYVPSPQDRGTFTELGYPTSFIEDLNRPHITLQAPLSDVVKMTIPYNNVRGLLARPRLALGQLGQIVFEPIVPLQAPATLAAKATVNITVALVENNSVGYMNPALNRPPPTPASLSLSSTALYKQLQSFFNHVPTEQEWQLAIDFTKDSENKLSADDLNVYGRVCATVHAKAGCGVCKGEKCSCGETSAPPSKPEDAKAQGGDLGSLLETGLRIAGTAAEFGFLDRPVDVRPAGQLIRRTAGSMISADGVTHTQTLSLSEGLVAPSRERLPDPVTLGGAVTRSGFFGRFDFPTETAADDELITIPVSPLYYDNAVGVGQTSRHNTWLSYASRPFAFWRGSLKFHFQVVCTSITHGRLAIIWEPANQEARPLPGGFRSNLGFYTQKVWDINGPSETDFTVDFLSENPWCLVGCESAVPPIILGNYNGIGSFPHLNGVLHVIVANEFTINAGAPPDFSVLVYVEGGDDFELLAPYGINLMTTQIGPTAYLSEDDSDLPILNYGVEQAGYNTYPTYTNTAAIYPLGGEDQGFGKFASAEEQKNTLATQNGPRAPSRAPDIAGESHMHLYGILSRDQLFATLSLTPVPNLPRQHLYIPVTPQISNTTLVSGQNAGVPVRTGCTPTLMAYFSRMAAYWHGSLRYKFVLRSDNPTSVRVMKASFIPRTGLELVAANTTPVTTGDLCRAQLTANGFTIYGYVPTTKDYQAIDLGVNSPSSFGIALEQIYQQGVLDVQVPFFTPRQYLGLSAGQFIGRTPEGGFQEIYPAETVLGFLELEVSGHSTGDDALVECYIAAGDDLVFSMYNLPPSTSSDNTLAGLDQAKWLSSAA